MKDKIKVACYCRVSTSQKQQLNSAENQKYYFENEFNYTNNDYELYNIYADVGVSGTKLKRPEFDKMLNDAGLDIKKIQNNDNDERKEYIKYTVVRNANRKPKFKYIIVKNTSRFARNVSADDILKELYNNGVYVLFLDINKSTEHSENFMFIQLFQTFDENESRDRSRKVKWGFERGHKQGNIYTNKKIFGFDYLPHPENRLIINEEQSKVVKMIFDLYESGEGIRRIINILTDSGIFTEQNKPFCKTSIKNILNNEKYAGLNNSLKYNTGEVFNKTSYPKVKDNYKVLPTDKIPSIITQEQFYKCRDLMISKVNHKNQVGQYKGNSKYKGLIYCGNCGSVYHSNVDRGRIFYNCSNKKMNGLLVCDNPNINESAIDKFFNDKLDKSYCNFANDNNKLTYVLNEAFEQEVGAFCMIILTIVDNLKSKIDNNNQDKANKIMQLIELKKDELKQYYKQQARENSNNEILIELITDTENELMDLQKQHTELTKTNDEIEAEIRYCFEQFEKAIYYQKGNKEWVNQIKAIIIYKNQNKINLKVIIPEIEEMRGIVNKYKKEFNDYLKNNKQAFIDKYGIEQYELIKESEVSDIFVDTDEISRLKLDKLL